tara:strand:+ start:353 stop:604 length:252 start_codon:yes stop_codon:yes gene_type:complete
MTINNQIGQFNDLSELISTKEVCLKCFGKYTDSTRQNIYNYIREGIFPKPRIKKRGNYKFSNREIFQFVRYGILPEHLDGNES